MCGRFLLTTPGADLAEHFGLEEIPDLAPRYNIAPTQSIAIVLGGLGSARRLAQARWGLIPRHTRETARLPLLINARAETLQQKPVFRDAFRSRRCLIPASGFYEWRASGRRRAPYVFRAHDAAPLAFAGLWDSGERGPSEGGLSCAIITTTANDVVRPVHDRMPVILAVAAFPTWLREGQVEAETLRGLLVPCPTSLLSTTALSPYVNASGHEGPECLAPCSETPLVVD
jgi:putative SOS response-associated peptidase YedK